MKCAHAIAAPSVFLVALACAIPCAGDYPNLVAAPQCVRAVVGIDDPTSPRANVGRVTGVVQSVDGSPVADAVIVSSLGGQVVSQRDGSFSLPLDALVGASIMEITAVATIKGVTRAAHKHLTLVVGTEITDAGVLMLTSGGGAPTCAELAWLPTFGQTPGMASFAVQALAVFDDGSGAGPALYAGGAFSTAGGVEVNRIARWNGTSWSPLGLGISGGLGGGEPYVSALAVFDDGLGGGPALFVAGRFTLAGGEPANGIAKWNGAEWSSLGSGISGEFAGVFSLAVFDDRSGDGPALYAGGWFTTAGGLAANRIARWDGSAWSPVGGGVNGTGVYALAVFDDGFGGGSSLYAGGDFGIAGGVAAARIARWDGQAWSALGGGVSGLPNSYVLALTVFNDGGGPALIVGGNFATAGGAAASRIARWNGASWAPLGSGTNNLVRAMTVFDDGAGGGPALYAGGEFTIAGGVSVSRIAKWNGSSWASLGSGIGDGFGGGNPYVNALTVCEDGSRDGPKLCAGGSFNVAGGVAALHIGKWNGIQWSSFGDGMNSYVSTLAVCEVGSGGGAELYAGGSFTSAGGMLLNRIAKWNGASWSAVGGGMDGMVRALVVFDDGSGNGPALYAGGSFTTADSVTVNGIAKWNGVSWAPLGNGVSGGINSLTVFDDGLGGGPGLYAGGSFTTAGGVPANCIAKWDGASWTPLGSGISGSVNSLTVFDDDHGDGPALYVGGNFATAGGVAAHFIAKWNGTQWSPLGSGVGGVPIAPYVYALTVFDDESGGGPALYAGGNFATAGGVAASRIAKWNGTQWSPLGSGIGGEGYPSVSAITVFDDGSGDGPALYVGGGFATAGGLLANGIAKWNGRAWSLLGDGMPGTAAFTAFDDGSGSGLALYAGGYFQTSPAGDSYIAKWGCEEFRSPCSPADFNCDGVVDGNDLVVLLGGWGQCRAAPCIADINDDGVIDGTDLAIVLGAWG